MLYQIRGFMNEHTLKMLYYATPSYVAVYNMEFQFGALQRKPSYLK